MKDTGADAEGESLSSTFVAVTLWGISSGFPLANHFDFPGSQSTLVYPQIPPNPPMQTNLIELGRQRGLC